MVLRKCKSNYGSVRTVIIRLKRMLRAARMTVLVKVGHWVDPLAAQKRWCAMAIMETAKLNGLDPRGDLAEVLNRMCRVQMQSSNS
ncbi:hypothetical protein SAMN05443999_104285 [Roseovarius azorensis]|uniref:Uncharacterized protein n=1 Tax=Roseovarius azorensis TaxID=1287727 RepID=A0A1H7P341_9RHOB|nr:hypothetical protein [Roseovarius azorensis]SEL29507.1 hypothetical protein SAMN05443999_104285 [Roseovarius azorensis]